MKKSKSSSEKPQMIYNSLLVQYSMSMKTNRLARELATKYHKVRHKKPRTKSKPKIIVQSRWPVESSLFTKVLQDKLQSILPKKFLVTQERGDPLLPPIRTPASSVRRKRTPIKFDLIKVIKEPPPEPNNT